MSTATEPSTTYPGPDHSTLPAAVAASGPAQSPDGGGTSPTGNDWNDFQITHRGSYSQNPGFDDLIAHFNDPNNPTSPKSGNLYFYTNNPNPNASGRSFPSTVSPMTSPPLGTHPACTADVETGNCATYPGTTTSPDTSNWSDVTQILEPGDAWTGSANDNLCGSTDPRTPGTPSLLTVENDQLWLYQGGCSDTLDRAGRARLKRLGQDDPHRPRHDQRQAHALGH